MRSVNTNKKSLELKKHINAIHCSNSLSLVQRKLFNALLYNAYPDLPHKQQFEIRGKDLYQLIGYNSNDTAKLKEALIGLITIAIEWNVIDCSTGQEKKWKASSILASAELSNGVCIYEYSQVMKDLMYQPEIYGQINVELMSKFKSGYGLALYENCIRYKGLKQTPWFPIDIFRKLMGVFDGKYVVFKDFKKRVVDVGVNEVNSVSPIRIYPDIERINQRVTRIRFKLETNINESPIALSELAVDDKLKPVLINTFGFSSQMVDETYENYDTEYIREKVEMITQSESFSSGKIRGLAGYLMEALKKDYKPSKSSKVIINERRKISEAKEKEINDKIEKQEDRYKQYVNKKINNYLMNLTQEQSNDLIREFELFIKENQNTIFKCMYKKYGLEHPATKSDFHRFIKENKQNEIGTIISMEDYIELID
ncbi:replication initiation protein (plasmid) [Legionella lytica]|uniref:Replication initiation protein n=1 Tax=Legionella lytica TaxID=96232 RepID=A0ABY4YD58_9GAMM|nr:replication initiation protein [Legionella lytica]USQ15555.1 replication initiation protein [Legionella lytica]